MSITIMAELTRIPSFAEVWAECPSAVEHTNTTAPSLPELEEVSESQATGITLHRYAKDLFDKYKANNYTVDFVASYLSDIYQSLEDAVSQDADVLSGVASLQEVIFSLHNCLENTEVELFKTEDTVKGTVPSTPNSITKPQQFGGVCDLWVLSKRLDIKSGIVIYVLTVCDYKTGWRKVSAERNAQLLTYTLAILEQYEEIGKLYREDKLIINHKIFQPAFSSQMSFTYTVEEDVLETFERKLTRSFDVQNSSTIQVFQVGSHCLRCAGSTTCKTYLDYVDKSSNLGVYLKDIESANDTPKGVKGKALIDTCTNDIATIFKYKKEIEKLLKFSQESLTRILTEGTEEQQELLKERYPFITLVDVKKAVVWSEEITSKDSVEEQVLEIQELTGYELEEDLVGDKVLKTPAKLRKILTGEQYDAIEHLFHYPKEVKADTVKSDVTIKFVN